MTVLLFIIFFVLAAVAVGFAVWPLLRGDSMRGRFVLAGAIAALTLGLGIGTYVMLGTPSLALRSLTGPSDNDIRGLVATLAARVRQTTDDPHGWMLLGRGYLTLGDPADAAASFKQALLVTPPAERAPLYSAYGEALTLAEQGAVPPEAEAAFGAALKLDPHDNASRFYLGQVYAQRGDRTDALAMWSSLEADVPPGSPLHGMLVDRIASLTAQSGGVPDIAAMVDRLAARLKANPNDPAGWQRLIRAYAVLGEKDKAQSALSNARNAMKTNTAALAALTAEARQDGL